MRVAARTGASSRLDEWRDIKLSQQFQVLATGLVIVSDWIASNADLFAFYSDLLPEVQEAQTSGSS